MKIKIKGSEIEAIAELYNTKTARAIYEILPTKGIANTWGDEVYFSCSLLAARKSILYLFRQNPSKH